MIIIIGEYNTSLSNAKVILLWAYSLILLACLIIDAGKRFIGQSLKNLSGLRFGNAVAMEVQRQLQIMTSELVMLIPAPPISGGLTRL